MSEGTGRPRRLVGLKQSRKAVREGRVQSAYVAADADEALRVSFYELCKEHAVPVYPAESMEKLGAEAGIEVPSAVMVLLK